MITGWNLLCTSTATVATWASQDAKSFLSSCVLKRKSVHLQAGWCLVLSVCRGQINHSALTLAEHTNEGTFSNMLRALGDHDYSMVFI